MLEVGSGKGGRREKGVGWASHPRRQREVRAHDDVEPLGGLEAAHAHVGQLDDVTVAARRRVAARGEVSKADALAVAVGEAELFRAELAVPDAHLKYVTVCNGM